MLNELYRLFCCATQKYSEYQLFTIIFDFPKIHYLKSRYLFVVFFYCIIMSAQQKEAAQWVQKLTQSKLKIEDHAGHLITDPKQRKFYFLKKQKHLDAIKARKRMLYNPPAVPLCNNGSFEEFQNLSGDNVLNSFSYTVGDPLNPIQCQSVSENANQPIKQYNPSDFGLMASTVPANFLDEYIGNINGFDQYCLQVSYKHLDLSAMGLVQAKRFKTDNETRLKFNYKAVLQTIIGSDHDNEQPYFKARVVSSSGAVVSEFCLIGDETNCIFSRAPNLEGGSVVLYTPMWQSGILDISSIPNNEEFTIEFMTSRCGLGGHFGYSYVDDICFLHTNENLQGSIELNPLYKICPTMPLSVCGDFTIPNSGGISATVNTIVLNVRNASNSIVYTSSSPVTLNLVTNQFCFNLQAADFPDVANAGYNVDVTINYGLLQTNCTGTSFNTASDDDANPGWDIWFLNCVACDIPLQTASLLLCDTNHNGREFFNLSNAETLITPTATGLTFSYFNTLLEATNNSNPIGNFANYESSTVPIFVRVMQSATCFKIIPISLIVKNPSASITGILNVCSGSTVLTASPGASYLWGNGATTPSITVNATGNYTVAVTDNFGCMATGAVTILNSLVAVQPTIVVTQPTCFFDTGTIEITSVASEYSYDNGVTWSNNALMSNLAVGTYKIKIRTAAGCTSYGTNISIVPFLSSFPEFSSINPVFCGDIGSITITATAPWYSFDDGLTWTPNNTKTGLPSGTYLVRIKDSFGCISNFNSVVLNGEFLDAPLFISNDPYCGITGDITITTPAALYSFDGGTTWQTSNMLGNLTSGSYIIKIQDAQGCTSPNVYVYLDDLQNSYPKYIISEASCGIYASITITTRADAYSFDGGLTWTTDPVLSNLVGGIGYNLKVRKGANCFSYTRSIYIYSRYKPIPVANDYETTLCDDLNDGSENVDLTLFNANLISNSASFTFTYFRTLSDAENFNNAINNFTSYNLSNSNNSVFVRVTSAEYCHKEVALRFSFLDSPIIVMGDSFPLCVSKTVFIDAGAGFDGYLWTNGETTQIISIDKPGTYTVTVTQNHQTSTGLLVCSSTKTFNIFLSNPASITKIQTSDWTDYNNMISVVVIGIGNYEYSLDGIHYQDSPSFFGLESGNYSVYVHDKNECGTVKQDVFLLMYPRYFTPNNDTYNDFWKIKFSEFESELTIELFDRNGKLLKELGSRNGWDGTFNGKELPATDYWFKVTRGNGKVYRGHFTLKR